MYVHNILGETTVVKKKNYRSRNITDYWHYFNKKEGANNVN